MLKGFLDCIGLLLVIRLATHDSFGLAEWISHCRSSQAQRR